MKSTLVLFACAALVWGCGDDSSPGLDDGADHAVDESNGDIDADAGADANADVPAEAEAEAGADADEDGDAAAAVAEDATGEVDSEVSDGDDTDAMKACADVEPGSGGEGEPCAETFHCDGSQYCNRSRCACWPPGECVVADDCGNPGHSWPHDGCVGYAECTAGLCVWICP